ncbi:unnamed protein product [Larinioides sclopetarius]
MSCFKDVLNDGETNVGCQREGNTEYENYMQSFDHLVKSTTEETERRKRCVSVAYSLPCIGDANKVICGEDSSAMILSILKRVDILKWLCTDSDVHFLQTKFLDFLKMERETKDVYSSFFHSRKLSS